MNRARLPLQLPQQHKRLHIEYFPSYTLELNPNEGVWSSTKRALANTFPLDLDELIKEVIAAIEQLRRSPRTLRGCILQSLLPNFCAKVLHYLCRDQNYTMGIQS